MQLLDLSDKGMAVQLLVFGLAACAVWAAGTRVTRYADRIAEHTGIGRGVIGLVVLGGITSLPEMAVALFAALQAVPAMAVNNLLGGIAMQKAILAGVDGFIGKQALTVIVASQGLLLQGVMSILLLLLVAMAIVGGDVLLGGVGAWAWLILAGYVFSIWTISRADKTPRWMPLGTDNGAQPQPSGSIDAAAAAQPLASLTGKLALAAAVIFGAGFFLSTTAQALAEQTGLGQNLAGAVLLALATSLPELSTVTAAVRLRQYEMAIADILGTSMFNLTLIVLIDAVYRGPSVLNLVGDFSLLTTLLCVLMATIYLAGMIERRNQTIFRFGVDSIVILLCYAGGLVVLFQLR